MARRRRNKISAFRLQDNSWCYDDAMLKQEAIDFFSNLYTVEGQPPGPFPGRGYFLSISRPNFERLQRQVLRCKYRVGDGIPDTINRHNCSFIWKSLMKVWEDLKGSVCWKVGNDQNIRFWHDCWIPHIGPLINFCTNPNVIDNDVRLCAMVDEYGRWDWPQFRSYVDDTVAMHIVAMKPPVPHNNADGYMWRWSKKGNFNIADTFGALSQASNNPTDDKWNWA
ncbi:hypothetical protein K2173_024213 [Erythroxylum novogranatense]|uniref:Uncharacterized protein n=1 Tax=Erythroxylum novogranatense TaxID=1862640 RepID=A0AAV8UFT3_9ROSI|nr:hypothetical protein K2173_024213 [Erythroxylum novogranatense]